MTKAADEQELQKLRRKCLFLWSAQVKKNAGNQCEAWEKKKRCEVTKRLNAHHIESYITNKHLRYDPKNGLCLCPKHHKFGWYSAHKSFVFMYEIMVIKRADDLAYLVTNRGNKFILDKESLLTIIDWLHPKPTLIKRVK